MAAEFTLNKRSTSSNYYVNFPTEEACEIISSPAKSVKVSSLLTRAKKAQTYQTSFYCLKEVLNSESETSSVSQTKSNMTDSKQLKNCCEIFERLGLSKVNIRKIDEGYEEQYKITDLQMQERRVKMMDSKESKSEVKIEGLVLTEKSQIIKPMLNLKADDSIRQQSRGSDLTNLFLARMSKTSKHSEIKETFTWSIDSKQLKLDGASNLPNSSIKTENTNFNNNKVDFDFSTYKIPLSHRKFNCSIVSEIYTNDKIEKPIANLTYEGNNSEFLNTKLGDFHSDKDELHTFENESDLEENSHNHHMVSPSTRYHI